MKLNPKIEAIFVSQAPEKKNLKGLGLPCQWQNGRLMIQYDV